MKAQVFTYRPVGWGQELGKGQLEGEEGLRAQEEELLGMTAEGDGAQVERLAKDLVEEIELNIEESEQLEKKEDRKELKEVAKEEESSPAAKEETIKEDK